MEQKLPTSASKSTIYEEREYLEALDDALREGNNLPAEKQAEFSRNAKRRYTDVVDTGEADVLSEAALLYLFARAELNKHLSNMGSAENAEACNLALTALQSAAYATFSLRLDDLVRAVEREKLLDDYRILRQRWLKSCTANGKVASMALFHKELTHLWGAHGIDTALSGPILHESLGLEKQFTYSEYTEFAERGREAYEEFEDPLH